MEKNISQLEKELKNTKDWLSLIFEHAPDAYFVCDLKGNLIDGNSAAEKLSGYRKEELIGKNILKLKLVPSDQIPKVAKHLTEHILGKVTDMGDFTLLRKDGTRVFVEISGTAVKFKGKLVLLGIARDITERTKAEEALKQKNEELEAFNKMAVGRELKIIELKERIKELEEKLKNNKKGTG